MHKIYINHLGPVEKCEMTINQFNVLTGPQSNGKSTIAKAIYYCRSLKQDILNVMMQGGPTRTIGESTVKWLSVMQMRMKEKFLQIFGTSWIMPNDMMVEYHYEKENVWLRVTLTEDWNNIGHNFVNIEFSPEIVAYFAELDTKSYLSMTVGQKAYEEKALSKLLSDPYETVFIPAGRNLITLLSEQLNYIFTSLEESQLRNIDYVTKRYTELILKLKPMFAHGIDGYVSHLQELPEQNKKYIANRPAINLLRDNIKAVLCGSYRYVDGEERLYIDEKKYVKINFASSGQQEIVWVFNLLFYYLVEDKRVFLILEEPESHLYPSSQRIIGEILALFLNEDKNAELVTTHSPYLLGTFNYLLQAGQSGSIAAEEIKKELRKRYWLDPDFVNAFYIHDGYPENAMDSDDGLTLIKNELIDGASIEINKMTDFILEQNFQVENEND